MFYYHLHDTKRDVIAGDFLDFNDVNHNQDMIDYLYTQCVYVDKLPKTTIPKQRLKCPNNECNSSLFTEHLQNCIKIKVIDISIEYELSYHNHECIACKTKWYNVKLPSNQLPYIDEKGRYVLDNPTEDTSTWQVITVYNRDEVPTGQPPPDIKEESNRCSFVSYICDIFKKMIRRYQK